MKDEIILLMGGAFLSVQGWHLIATIKLTTAVKILIEKIELHDREIERLKLPALVKRGPKQGEVS